MKDWRQWFMRVFGPGVLGGVTFGDWLGLLSDNAFHISPRYFTRAMAITWQSLLNTPTRWMEHWRYARRIEAVDVPPPLFVLGHWRSGTTLLHDLLAVDTRFACPTLYQVIYPHTFLSTEALGSLMLRLFSPKNRPQDNMKLDPASPWEDEFAMCAWGFMSSYLAWEFPQRAAHYDRFLSFESASPGEVRRWREILTGYLKKLTFKHRRPLILKSPTHTCRIKLLLEMFPDARFVHIHRNPYDVFRSCQHLYATVIPLMRLQSKDGFDWTERIIRQYVEMHDAYFRERDLIPAGRLHDVCFEELEKDPVGQVGTVYESLGLPWFGEVEPRLREYVASISRYQKNAYQNLAPDLRERVATDWARCFREWGYPTGNG